MGIKDTAWAYCRECDKFDDGTQTNRPCSGMPFDFEIKDGQPPCEKYAFDDGLLAEKKQ